MTVTYTAEVATSKFGSFWKLLVRWRGSIYKLLWPDFLLFVGAYYTLNLIYRFGLKDDQKRLFEKVAMYCEMYNNLIPVAFVLGFYVSIVVSRWWEQFQTIPWPDRMALFVTAMIHGHDERGRLMRRTIMRYLCLAQVMTLAAISSAVKKRFPTIDHMTEAGFLLPNESKIIEEIQTPHPKYFVPLVWTTSLVTRARKEGRIKDDFAVKTLIDEINAFRGGLGSLFNYDWISVPLVYTQVVTLAVYTFFLSCLMGRQILIPDGTNIEKPIDIYVPVFTLLQFLFYMGWLKVVTLSVYSFFLSCLMGRQFLDPGQHLEGHRVDVYVPVFTFLQFFFYMGWLKVAETLVNPFGEDDDDFEMNWVIDRNLQVSYLVVDEMHSDHPELIKDQYWDEVDFELPYTAAAEQFKMDPHMGSAVDINVHPMDAEFVPMSSIPEDGVLDTAMKNLSIKIPRERTENDLPRASMRRLTSSSPNNRLRTRSPATRPGLLNSLKRSMSRDSRHSSMQSSTSKLSRLGEANQEFSHLTPTRIGSVTSVQTNNTEKVSPASASNEEIFSMSDLSSAGRNGSTEGEDEPDTSPEAEVDPTPLIVIPTTDTLLRLKKKIKATEREKRDVEGVVVSDSDSQVTLKGSDSGCSTHEQVETPSNIPLVLTSSSCPKFFK